MRLDAGADRGRLELRRVAALPVATLAHELDRRPALGCDHGPVRDRDHLLEPAAQAPALRRQVGFVGSPEREDELLVAKAARHIVLDDDGHALARDVLHGHAAVAGRLVEDVLHKLAH